jgi:hypothetical protein
LEVWNQFLELLAGGYISGINREQGAFQALNFLIITAPRPSSNSVAGSGQPACKDVIEYILEHKTVEDLEKRIEAIEQRLTDKRN